MSVPQVGQKIDNYELVSVLGEGGLGVVFKAIQLDVGRTVAIKVLHAHVASEEFQSRFLREAQILSKLSHVNIVTVYHMGISSSGLTYLVMEMAEGKSLRQILFAEDRLETVRALTIARDTAKALGYVHKHGVIHRDLKLENILLMDNPEPDTVKIIDFGLAGLTDEQNQRLTKTGALIGTVSYMSPEQCTGQQVDHRSDIYSLAVCLYEMISGYKPFDADTPVGVMYQHMNNATPSVQQRCKLKRYASELDQLIAQAMNKKPSDRFQTMEEFAEEIERVIDILEGRAAGKASSKTQRKSLPIVAGIFVLILVVTLAALPFVGRQSATKDVPIHRPKTARYSITTIFDTLTSGQAARAREMCDSTLKFDLPLTQRIETLMLRGQVSQCPGSIYYYSKAIALSQSSKTKLLRLSAYMWIARHLQIAGLESEALKYLHKVQYEYKPGEANTRLSIEFTTRDELECLVNFADTCILLGKEGAREYLSMAVESCGHGMPDINACWVRILGDLCRIKDDKLAKQLIGYCSFTYELSCMGIEATSYNKMDLAQICLSKAKAKMHYEDGHKLYREAGIVLCESHILIEQGKLDKAIEILEKQAVYQHEMPRAERDAAGPLLFQNMMAAGIPPERAERLLGSTYKNLAREYVRAPSQMSVFQRMAHARFLRRLNFPCYALRELNACLELMNKNNLALSKHKEALELFTECQLSRAILLNRFGESAEAKKILDSLPAERMLTEGALMLALELQDYSIVDRIAGACNSVDSSLSCSRILCQHGLYQKARDCQKKAKSLLSSLGITDRQRGEIKCSIEETIILIESNDMKAARQTLDPLVRAALHDSHSMEMEDLSYILGFAVLCQIKGSPLDGVAPDELARVLQAREFESSH